MFTANRVTGLLLIAFGAGVLALSLAIPYGGSGLGPAAFPGTVACVLILSGGLIALGKQAAERDEEAQAEGLDLPPSVRLLRLALPPGLLVFYFLAAESLGFLATALPMILVSSLALGGRWRLALPLAVLAPGMIYVLFTLVLGVPLPPLLPVWGEAQ